MATGLGVVAIALWAWLHIRASRAVPRLLGAAVFVDFLLLSLLAVALADREKWTRLVREDGIVEWTTVFLLLVAAVLFGRRALSARRAADAVGVAASLALAAFCVFVAGEEVSWGQRLMGFTPPDVFLENNRQQEFNLHNFFNHIPLMNDVMFESGHIMVLIAISFGAVVPAVVQSRVIGALDRFKSVVPTLAGGSLLLGSAALALWAPMHLSDEVAECLFAAGFVVVAIEMEHFAPQSTLGVEDVARASASRFSLALQGAALIIAPFAVAIALDAVIASSEAGAGDEKVALAKAEAAQLADHILSNEALLHKTGVHKRIFTAVEAGYLKPTAAWTFLDGKRSPAEEKDPAEARRSLAVRRDRKGYFIDPWDNAYWVDLMPRLGKITVYSFGPNRRRDFDRRRAKAPTGDDVVVRRRYPSRVPPEIGLGELFPGLGLEGAAKKESERPKAKAP